MYTKKKVKKSVGKKVSKVTDRPIVTIALRPVEYRKIQRLARKNKVKVGAMIRALTRYSLKYSLRRAGDLGFNDFIHLSAGK